MRNISDINNKWTVKQLKDHAKEHNIQIPLKAKKAEIIDIIKKLTSDNEPTEEIKTEQAEVEVEEELEEEIIAGFDEDDDDEDDPALNYKMKIDKKFWQEPEFRVLLDTELAKDSKVAFYDLSNLVDNFFNKMLREDLINYKIAGIALKSAASLHHYKISSIIREEEQIQKKQELDQFRERHARTIPKALPQPIQPKMQIATKDELFDAMRAAIIDTMQKKEKLKRRRVKREESKQKTIKMRSKAKLPKEILKHITGKEQTVGELHASWLKRIKASINLNESKETSFFELMNIVKQDENSSVGRSFALVRMFLALTFLSTKGASGTGSTLTEIELYQDDEFQDINIRLKR